jgi:urease accessory protein
LNPTPKLEETVVAKISVSTKPPPDWLLWQLADSAFPTGGFAHSAGLEAAWQHGEVRDRVDLDLFIKTSLGQSRNAALPFVAAAYDEPGRFAELDRLCDAFHTNHVANRASRLQGRAFLAAVERIRDRGVVPEADADRSAERPEFAHFAPSFGVALNGLAVTRAATFRLFVFNHLRAILAAAVRLNIIGPMEAQATQRACSAQAEQIAVEGGALALADLAQTAPLLDLWQGSQDRLYSRLFQS